MIRQLLISIIWLLASCSLNGQIDSSFSNPHAALYNHLFYLQKDSYDPGKSARSFDPKMDKNMAIDAAVKLKQVLDGGGYYVYLNRVPDTEDYRDSLNNKHQYYPFPKELPEVFLEKKAYRWQYSEETVKAIPRLHKQIYPLGTDYLLKLVPTGLTEKILGLETWQYLGILFLLLLSIILFFLLRWVLRPLLKKLSRISFHMDLTDKKLINRTSHVLSLLAVFILIKYLFPVLQLPAKWALFTKKGLGIIITVFLALLILRIVDYLISYFRTIADRTESKMDDQLLPIISQMIKLVIIIGAAFQVLHLLNVNVTALIAGISIGGLALALAAKDTVSNLIGSLMVFMDRPFQIGDYVEVGGFAGTVKEVGFRSTRIQTKDTSVISIPNGTVANTSLVNKGIRVFRLFETTLGVTYDTPPHLIEVFLEGLRKLVVAHPRVSDSEYYINMSGFGPSSLDILFRVYIDTNVFAEELAIKEDLILSVLRMAEAIGIRFAFPSTTVYVEQFPGQKDLIPDYENEVDTLHKKMNNFFEEWQKNHKDLAG